ncbi:MAG: ATP-binding protein [Tannerellaceae bacterium]|nr:ATP-binding protein [Tannerellaceae bacterium]
MVRTLHITNDLEQLSSFEEFLQKVCSSWGINEKTAMGLHLAVEEAVVNVIHYAYPGQKNQPIELKVQYDAGKIIFTLTDHGALFDPTSKEDPDITLGLDERPIGGLGIFLARKLMTEINYKRSGNKNILTMIKELP